MEIIASGPSDGPSFPTAAAVSAVLRELEELQNTQTERLTFEQFEALAETATILRTMANTHSSDNVAFYFSQQLQQAHDQLDQFRERFK